MLRILFPTLSRNTIARIAFHGCLGVLQLSEPRTKLVVDWQGQPAEVTLEPSVNKGVKGPSIEDSTEEEREICSHRRGEDEPLVLTSSVGYSGGGGEDDSAESDCTINKKLPEFRLEIAAPSRSKSAVIGSVSLSTFIAEEEMNLDSFIGESDRHSEATSCVEAGKIPVGRDDLSLTGSLRAELIDRSTRPLPIGCSKPPVEKVNRKLSVTSFKEDSFSDPFITRCWEFSVAETRVEEQFAKLSLCKLHRDIESANRMLDFEIKTRSEKIKNLFQDFARRIGFRVTCPDVTFNKKESDHMLQALLGSCSVEESGDLNYMGLEYIGPPEKKVSAAFSLYMCRKRLSPPDPRDFNKSLQSFYERSTSKQEPLGEKEKEIYRGLFKVLFGKVSSNEKNPPPPVCGKACLERTRSEGGKRAFLYRSEDNLIPDVSLVKAAAIYSGGKIRVITVSSAIHQKYSFLNEWMLGKLRKFPWCVSGREIEDWIPGIQDQFVDAYKNGRYFVSGDLKSSTDYLSREIAELAVDQLCKTWNLEGQEDTMKAALTQSILVKKHRGEWRCAIPSREGKDELWDRDAREASAQRSGWHMGSDFSFPILCVSSLVSVVKGAGKGGLLYSLCIDRSKGWRSRLLNFLSEFKEGGVNGDDQVCPGEKADWLKAVEENRGVPEPSKSPYNKKYFTINSRLMKVDEDGVHVVKTLHISKLISCLGDSAKTPDRNWSDIFDNDFADAFPLSWVAFPNIPTQLGGTAYEFLPFNDHIAKQLAFLMLSKEERIGDELRYTAGGREVIDDEQTDYRTGGFSYVMVKKVEHKIRTRRRFENKKSIYWTAQNYRRPELALIDDIIDDFVIKYRDDLERYYNRYWYAECCGYTVCKTRRAPTDYEWWSPVSDLSPSFRTMTRDTLAIWKDLNRPERKWRCGLMSWRNLKNRPENRGVKLSAARRWEDE